MNFGVIVRDLFYRIRHQPIGRRGRRDRAAISASVTSLEPRLLLAAVTDDGQTLSIDLNANEQLSVSTDGSTYTFVSTLPLVNGGVTSADAFSGFDSDTLIFDAVNHYTTVSITDSGSGARLLFLDSGTRSYRHDFQVDLSGEVADSQAVGFVGTSRFFDHDLTVNTDRSIHLFSGSLVTMRHGNISLTAHNVGDTGDLRGVEMVNAGIRTTGTGNIVVNGTASDLAHDQDSLIGISLRNGSFVSSTATTDDAGTITLNGTGGGGTSFNTGILITMDSGVVSSQGDVFLTGRGGHGSGEGNVGIEISAASTVASNGIRGLSENTSARLNIDGVGGNGTDRNQGVVVDQSVIRTVMGQTTVTGRGGDGSGSSNYGVIVNNNSLIQTVADADITIDGTGGAGVNWNVGTAFSNGSNLFGDGGVVSMIGNGGAGSGSNNRGVSFFDFDTIRVGDGLSIIGVGGSGTNDSGGGFIGGESSEITTFDGDILISGDSGLATSGYVNGGIWLAVDVQSWGDGAITIEGTAGETVGTAFNRGVDIAGADTQIRSTRAPIMISGRGGDGAENNNDGIRIHEGVTIAGLMDDISLNGTAGNGDSYGVRIDGNETARASIRSGNSYVIQIAGQGSGMQPGLHVGAGVQLSGASLDIRTDTIALDASANLHSSGTLKISPLTAGTSIGLGGAAGTLNLDDAELATISNGFASIHFGDVTTGDVRLQTATLSDPVFIAGTITGRATGTDLASPGHVLSGTIHPGERPASSSLSAMPGLLKLQGDTVISSGSVVNLEVGGAVAGDTSQNHSAIQATGTLQIEANVQLSLIRHETWQPLSGQVLTIVERGLPAFPFEGGQFQGLPEGAALADFFNATISYVGGDGNDITLTMPTDFSLPPRIIGPAEAIADVTPTFAWTPFRDAASYEVWVELIGGSNNPVVHVMTQETSLVSPVALSLGRYRTWVRGIGNDGSRSAWSSQTFTMALPTTLDVASVAAGVDRPTISWTPVDGAVNYQLYVSNITTGQNALIDQTVNETSFTPTERLAFGRYRVWVRPVGAANYQGVWSEPLVYSVGPQPVAPRGSIAGATVEFSWNPIAGAASYQLWVSGPGGVVVNQSDITASAFTASVTLPAGDFRWWVRGFTESGQPGGWGDAAEFSTGGRTKINVPEVTTVGASFSWPAVPDAESYEIYIGRIGVLGALHRVAGIDVHSYPELPLNNGHYQVWIRTMLQDGRQVWGRG